MPHPANRKASPKQGGPFWLSSADLPADLCANRDGLGPVHLPKRDEPAIDQRVIIRDVNEAASLARSTGRLSDILDLTRARDLLQIPEQTKLLILVPIALPWHRSVAITGSASAGARFEGHRQPRTSYYHSVISLIGINLFRWQILRSFLSLGRADMRLLITAADRRFISVRRGQPTRQAALLKL